MRKRILDVCMGGSIKRLASLSLLYEGVCLHSMLLLHALSRRLDGCERYRIELFRVCAE
jgi:hypothetical protein